MIHDIRPAVMTDLTKVKAATTSPATTLRQAEQLMIYQGVRILLVVDGGGSDGTPPHHVRGIVSRAQVERQLGSTIDIVEIAASFAEIEKMLA